MSLSLLPALEEQLCGAFKLNDGRDAMLADVEDNFSHVNQVNYLFVCLCVCFCCLFPPSFFSHTTSTIDR